MSPVPQFYPYYFCLRSFVQSDGIEKSETGETETFPDGTSITRVRGWWSYPSEGKIYRVDYTADENGFVIQKPQAIAAAPLPPRVIQSLLGRK